MAHTEPAIFRLRRGEDSAPSAARQLAISCISLLPRRGKTRAITRAFANTCLRLVGAQLGRARGRFGGGRVSLVEVIAEAVAGAVVEVPYRSEVVRMEAWPRWS